MAQTTSTTSAATTNGRRRGFTCTPTAACRAITTTTTMMLRRKEATAHRMAAGRGRYVRWRFASEASPHPEKKAHVKVEERTHLVSETAFTEVISGPDLTPVSAVSELCDGGDKRRRNEVISSQRTNDFLHGLTLYNRVTSCISNNSAGITCRLLAYI